VLQQPEDAGAVHKHLVAAVSFASELQINMQQKVSASTGAVSRVSGWAGQTRRAGHQAQGAPWIAREVRGHCYVI